MIVNCEKCNSKFRLSNRETRRIRQNGRILKCGNCHHMWLATKSAAGFDKTHDPTDKALLDNLKDSKRPALILRTIAPDEPISYYFASQPAFFKITLYSLIFFLIFSVFILQKNFFIAKVPFVRTVLIFMGLTETTGLEIESVKIVKSSFEKDRPLIISGFIVNKAEKTLLVPDIRIQFLDKNGIILKSITHDLPRKALAPGEKSKITNRITNYPENTHDISLDIGNYLEFLLR